MNEIKSYEIDLNFSSRFELYISGALSWNQIFKKEPFYIKQNEIQWLFNLSFNQNIFVCSFERDKQIHQVRLDKIAYANLLKDNESLMHDKNAASFKIFKYLKSTFVFMFLAWVISSLMCLGINGSFLKYFFSSENCDAQCASRMGTISSVLVAMFTMTFTFPASYFLLRHFFLKKFAFKPGRPFFENIAFALYMLTAVQVLNIFYSAPRVTETLTHWKNGTLNKETIAQIESKFKKSSVHSRTAEAQSPFKNE